jgi:6-phosphogluconolactonase (cycloisomerase 2 family)
MSQGPRPVTRLAFAVVLLICAAADASNLHPAISRLVPWEHNNATRDVSGVVVSPDGAHVYTASPSGLGTFARSPVTEELTFVQSAMPEDGKIGSLPPLISPDGAHLYAWGFGGIRVYVREPLTGLLAFAGAAPISGNPLHWAVSPDGLQLYAHVNAGIQRFARDPGTGALTFLGSTASDLWPTGMAVAQDGTQLYVTSAGRLITFTRDPATGDLVATDLEVDGVDGVHGIASVDAVAVAPDGAHVYTASASSAIDGGVLAVFARDDATGALTFIAADTPAPGYHLDLQVAPDGTQVFLTGSDRVVVFSRNAATGLLTAAGAIQGGPGGMDGLEGRGRMGFAPGGGALYVAAPVSDALTVLRRDPGTGGLSPLEVHQYGHGALGNVLVASPDSRHLYTVSQWGTVTGFAFDPEDDTLTRVDTELDGLDGRDGFYVGLNGAASGAMSPDGRHLYVGTSGGYHSDDWGLTIFARDAASGALDFVGTAEPGRRVSDVLVSPDGAHVYTLYVELPMSYLQPLARDAMSGTLSAVGPAIPLGECPTDYPSDCYPGSSTISPDGRSVYIKRESVVVLSRDPVSGALTLLQRYTGVRFPAGMVVSPDGRHVYIATLAGRSPDPRPSITTLRRDPASGALTEEDVVRDIVLDAWGYGPSGLLASPNGEFIFGTSSGVNVFRRDTGTGRLGFVQWTVASRPMYGAVMRPDGVLVRSDLVDIWGADDSNSTSMFTTLRQAVHCAPAPLTSCRQPLAPGRSSLVVRKPRNEAKSMLTWKWTNGAATTPSDFGDPTTTAGQTLCVYDARPQAPLDMRMPAGEQCGATPCWSATTSTPGFRYGDRARRWDGVTKAVLTAGADGRASILLKAKGPIPLPPGAPLPFVPPVRVQLQSDTGECWEATFSTASQSDAQLFKARSD